MILCFLVFGTVANVLKCVLPNFSFLGCLFFLVGSTSPSPSFVGVFVFLILCCFFVCCFLLGCRCFVVCVCWGVVGVCSFVFSVFLFFCLFVCVRCFLFVSVRAFLFVF